MTQVLDKIAEKDKVMLCVLRKRRDFLRIARQRIKWVSQSMIVQVAPTPEEQGSSPLRIRVGYTASKKVGNAVRRNRAKRRLREVVRQVLPGKGVTGSDYVLIARSIVTEAPFDQLIRDFSWCLKRLSSREDFDKSSKTADKRPDKR